MTTTSFLPACGWPGDFVPIFLLALRLAAMLLMTPVLYAVPVPAQSRVLLIFGIAATLHTALPVAATSAPHDAGSVIIAAARELALGATMGLGVHVAFASFALAGRLLDIQAGFGMAQVLDPATHRQLPVLTSAFNQIGVLTFFLMNGHHALLRGLDVSLIVFPLGAEWDIANAAEAAFGQMSGLFTLGFSLVAPVVFCVFLVELAFGVLARNLPQMNIFLVALPAKIAVTFMALALWSSAIGPVMSRTYASIATNWEQIMLQQRRLAIPHAEVP